MLDWDRTSSGIELSLALLPRDVLYLAARSVDTPFTSSGELSALITSSVWGVSVTDFLMESSLAVEMASETKLSSCIEE